MKNLWKMLWVGFVEKFLFKESVLLGKVFDFVNVNIVLIF